MYRLDVTETFAGLSLPGHLHTQESLNFASTFQFCGSDVLLVTYPKSGTTWMQEILTLIYSDGDPRPAKTTPNWARTPWLEHIHFKELLQETEGPRLLTTHMPPQVLAASLRKAKPKVIHLVRNPKDVAVSFYHFCRMANFFPDPGSFDEFLLAFLDGTVHYGSWFEHTKGWLNCKEELDVFYITYEELHQVLSETGGTTSPRCRLSSSRRSSSRKWEAAAWVSWTDGSTIQEPRGCNQVGMPRMFRGPNLAHQSGWMGSGACLPEKGTH
ncbi:sulfotransferase 2B1-like isoform X2 [Rhineura floridana]|uniref:sulfotransferase 2B1-like isoform X2 n=1 Tax=Rhineura floridana TaxID=261503 RepID=UPI002AC84E90|nr:sulfotransferase 2B1-like isoform X2 [Rhineura floridana]